MGSELRFLLRDLARRPSGCSLRRAVEVNAVRVAEP
jgi:hypothetical protein